MPKKTKKEKLLAQQHRMNLASVAKHATSETNAVSFKLPVQHKATSPSYAIAEQEYTLIKRDLIKTVILTSVILISELLLAQSLLR